MPENGPTERLRSRGCVIWCNVFGAGAGRVRVPPGPPKTHQKVQDLLAIGLAKVEGGSRSAGCVFDGPLRKSKAMVGR